MTLLNWGHCCVGFIVLCNQTRCTWIVLFLILTVVTRYCKIALDIRARIRDEFFFCFFISVEIRFSLWPRDNRYENRLNVSRENGMRRKLWTNKKKKPPSLYYTLYARGTHMYKFFFTVVRENEVDELRWRGAYTRTTYTINPARDFRPSVFGQIVVRRKKSKKHKC